MNPIRLKELLEIIRHSLTQAEENFSKIGQMNEKRLNYSDSESAEYLAAFIYRLGYRERIAIMEF